MIVLIAGMQRSGSTFSFNVVRELLKRRGSVYQEPIIPVLKRAGAVDHIIFKEHDVDDLTIKMIRLGAIKTICTVRKPEDAIASWMETFHFGLDEAISHVEGWLRMYQSIRDCSLTVSNEQIDLHPWYAASRIGRYVCRDASMLECLKISRKFSKANVKAMTKAVSSKIDAFDTFDEENFFHPGHVSSIESRPACLRIGDEAVITIRKRLSESVDDTGRLR